MKLVMTLLVRDEADIIEANLDYHFRQGVDFVIATDHSSRDGTADLLRGYERDGVLLLREAGGEAFEQVAHVNAMARAAAVDHGADWVINNDADEFWWPLVGNLKDILSAVPEEFGALVASRTNYLPRAAETDPFFESMIVRERASKNRWGEPLEPKLVHRATAEIEIEHGNHSIRRPNLALAPDLGLLEVLHFPMRSFEQFERKVHHGGIGLERLEGRRPEVGRDQLALLELQREGRLREHFNDLVVDEAGLEEALAGGSIVVDTRLRDFMARSDSGDQGLPRDRAAKLVSSALGLARQLDAARREVDTARAELAAARAELARLHEEAQAAHAGREHAERRLVSTDAALKALQRSRLIRYSEPARRLYYRLRGQG